MKYPDQESSILEFKREMPKNDQVIKTIVGFCNQKGGKIVIGVDNDGTIVGLDEAQAQQLMEYLEKAILDASFPPILTNIYLRRIVDKILLIVEVAQGMNKPYYIKNEGRDNGAYIRLGRSTVKAKEDTIQELNWNSRNISFDTMPVYQAKEDDLDIEKIKKFLAMRKNAEHATFPSLEQAMLSYQIITKEQLHNYPTVCGILLFGKSPQFFFPEARIMCNYFSGTDMTNPVIASKECLGTLDEQLHQARDFIVSQLYTSWKIVGVFREEKLELPEVAIREILINAIIHRNYHMPSPGKIAIFRNRIEIFSPGNFPGSLSLEQSIKGGLTYLRNQAICKIFREMNLIESYGLGFLKTFSSYEQAGIKAPEVIEGVGFIKCILPRGIPENMIKRSSKQELKLEHQHILRLFDNITEVAAADIIKAIGLTRQTATRRLTELVKTGYLKQIGKGRGVRYIKV